MGLLIGLFRFDGGERTVKKLRLSKALTISEGTMVSEACRRMAARRVDSVLLTDNNALLSGIMTDKVCVFSFCACVYSECVHTKCNKLVFFMFRTLLLEL